MVKVVLSAPMVIAGGVYFKGDVVEMEPKDAQMLIAHGKAKEAHLSETEAPLSSNDDIPPNTASRVFRGKKTEK